MYRIAYQEGQRTLDDQQSELSSLRDRAVQFTVFVGAATAFLVGTGLSAPSRDATFYGLAISGSVLSALAIALLFMLLKPSKKAPWNYRLSSNKLITGWIESDVPPPNEAYFLRSLAQTYDQMREANEVLLKSLRWRYQALLAAGAAQVTVWAALVWVKG
jgi:hypothetical protein